MISTTHHNKYLGLIMTLLVLSSAIVFLFHATPGYGQSPSCPRLKCVSSNSCVLMADDCDSQGNPYPNQCSSNDDCAPPPPPPPPPSPVSASCTIVVLPQPLDPTGTLTPEAPSCVIASGQSSCNINFSWTTANPVGTSAVTKPVNVTVATGNSGTNVPLAVKYNTETFYLYNNAVLLDQETVTSSCASGSAWDGSICAPFNYTLSTSGNSSVTKTSGSAYTSNTITKTLTSGPTESVSLSLSGVPSGTSYSISNSTCSPTCTSVITFTVTSSTRAGTYLITVTGSTVAGPPLSKEIKFNLVVYGNPIIVSCSASPGTALLGETVTWTANVSGGTPPLIYSWSGTNIPTSPAPPTRVFNISYGTIGQKTAAVTVTDIDLVTATCPASVVRINFNPQLEEF